MVTRVIFLTSGTTWTVPQDWTPSNNTIEAIGGGGGSGSAWPAGGAGGGGGAYTKLSNLQLIPGQTVYINIGTGAATPTANGGDTWLNSLRNAAPTSSATGVLAKGGSFSSNTTGGLGGQASACIPSATAFSGGNGGNGGVNGAGGGGGGAGGPSGAGANGGNPVGTAAGGGGGSNGGSGGSSPGAGGASGGSPAGSGGAAATSGAAAVAGGIGAGGGGGGGGLATTNYQGGAGGAGNVYIATQGTVTAGTVGGPGGGSGGGTSTAGPATTTGSGGLYGGGQGNQNGDTSGSAGQGIIVITYTPPSYASRLAANGSLYVGGSIDELTNNPITFGSLLFDGSTGYLTLPSNSAFTIGTGDFTIETWLYPTSFKRFGTIFSTTSLYTVANNFYLQTDANGNKIVLSSNGTVLLTSNNTLNLNAWNHIAAVRSGTTLTIYINGLSQGSVTNSQSFVSDTPNIGSVNATTYPISGYISNFRIVNGTAIYTANVTPPTQPLTAVTNTKLLLNTTTIPSTSAFTDIGPNNFSVTSSGTVTSTTQTPIKPNGYYNYYFNNANPDFIMASPSASYQLTGDFTIECWIYGIGTGAAQFGIVTLTNATSSGSNGLTIFLDTSSRLGFFVNGTSTLTYSATNTILANTWYHIALVRSGSTNTMYVNGLSVSTSATTPTWPATPSIGIGRFYNDNTTLTWNGYITNLRIVKGTAVYTANFTPQTSSLRSIPNTLLLTCQSNTIIDNSPNPITLTRTSGNAAVTSNTSPLSTYNYSGTGISVQRVTSTSNAQVQTGVLQVTGIFDEYTINGGSVARRLYPTGNLQIAGVFDEVTRPT
jgi:hypothetical protein